MSASASAPETPLAKLAQRLPDILTKANHTEMWGVELKDVQHAPTQVILTKFLRANNNDPVAAEQQLTSALEWRKEINPSALVTQTFSKTKFADLGFVTVHKDDADSNKTVVITWNIYGAVKDKKATFGDVDDFIKWRSALMELGVQQLKLNEIITPIPDGAEDPHQMIQVHDYLSVSFFRMDADVKAATRKVIPTMALAYPELLSHKYFVNVPTVMGFMYAAMKLVMAPATLRKFHPMSDGKSLALELPTLSSLPTEYGGKGGSVKEGLSIPLSEGTTKGGSVAPAVHAKTEAKELRSTVEETAGNEQKKSEPASTQNDVPVAAIENLSLTEQEKAEMPQKHNGSEVGQSKDKSRSEQEQLPAASTESPSVPPAVTGESTATPDEKSVSREN
ncbi:hypothetical protein S40293_08344 [Stachybotrys chartarum IBT 40293]|nr:hypothetical protein S40293_08344 [Stachybotrys chartarum IBT 40293]